MTTLFLISVVEVFIFLSMDIYILSLQDWETLVYFFEIRNGFYVLIKIRVPMSHQGKKVLIVFVVIVDQSAN